MSEKTGRVYLVGAGCGGAEWITLRGLRLLQGCDAVVYDDLIAPELLQAVPETAERFYMGKRQGRHAAPQEDINAQLIQLAQGGKTVVRLKGGDPFVFGRGGEELLALQAAGVPCEEVPGISSAIAIPAAAGIPVTHRGLSQSLHLVTGHTAHTPDGLPDDFDRLAGLNGTLVILMGLSRLPQIAARLLAAGKPPQTPAAVLSGGNALHPVTVRGTLADIADRAKAVQPPAVIVIGAVAALDVSSTVERPLSGVRIGLTGTAAVADKLRAGLVELGAEAVTVESSVVEELPVDFDWQSLTDDGPQWVVFTSSNGVRLFFRHLRREKLDVRRLHTCRFAVIGAATGETLAEYGLYPDLCPETYTSAGLGAALCDQVRPGERVLLFRSAQGSPELTAALAQKGIPFADIPTYTLRADAALGGGDAALPPLDYLTFSSASGVDLFHQTHGAIPRDALCVCIGEVTAQALGKRTDRPFLTAQDISAQGILDAILAHRQAAGATI